MSIRGWHVCRYYHLLLFIKAETTAVGVRAIAVDRPGYGQSDFCETRSYSQWAEDVAELADHLNVSELAVFGFSSGGPSALACGAHLGDDNKSTRR